MANEDNNLSFSLDLDNSEFLESVQAALEGVVKLGEGDISGLLSSFAEAAAAVGVAAAAVEAFKLAVDMSVEGEQIQQIDNQFKTLSAQAGISGDALKDGLEKAAGGLVSTTDLLKIANGAIVQMGASANQLPQIMDLARKATALMGGDLQTNFQDITQAIEKGNTRMLTHLGIVIDQKKAYDTYAQSIGVTSGELSKTGQQQAILNAVLTQGGEKFKGVNAQLGQVTTATQQWHTAVKELGELWDVVVSKVIGPSLNKVINYFGKIVHSAKTDMVAGFGEGTDQSKAKIEDLNDAIATTEKQLAELPKMGYGPSSSEYKAMEAQLSDYKTKLASISQVYKQQQADNDKANQEITTSNAKVAQNASIDAKKKQAVDNEVQKEYLKLIQERDKIEATSVTSMAQIDKLMKDQALLRERQHEEEIAQIKQKYAGDTSRIAKLTAAENDRYRAQERAAVQTDYEYKTKLLQSYQTNSTTVFQGISREAAIMARQAQQDFHNMAKFGQETMKSLEKNSTAAFQQIGTAIAQGQNIAQSTANAMAGFFLNMVADRATASGGEMLLEGFMNPALLAPGAGLIALGAALKSLAGSLGASSSTSVPTPSVSGGSSPSAPPITGEGEPDQASLESQQQTAQRAVTVNIAGNYLNTPQSQRALMDIMRSETDATGFQYNSIGATGVT